MALRIVDHPQWATIYRHLFRFTTAEFNRGEGSENNQPLVGQSSLLRVPTFSLRCNRGFRCSGMWRCVLGEGFPTFQRNIPPSDNQNPPLLWSTNFARTNSLLGNHQRPTNPSDMFTAICTSQYHFNPDAKLPLSEYHRRTRLGLSSANT